jgi:hypothetical protein
MAETLAQTAARLEAIRNSAISSTTVDGISTTIDQAVALQRLREIKRAEALEAGLPDPRPICARIKLT